MNEVMALSRRWGIVSAGEALTLPGSVSEGAAKQLPGSAEILMRTTYGLLEECILSALEKRSAADFRVMEGRVVSAVFKRCFGPSVSY